MMKSLNPKQSTETKDVLKRLAHDLAELHQLFDTFDETRRNSDD